MIEVIVRSIREEREAQGGFGIKQSAVGRIPAAWSVKMGLINVERRKTA